jgi:hypothetical protein
LPYSRAEAGQNAYGEIERILRQFGCSNFGVMNDWQSGKVIVQFEWRARRVSLEASWEGYAQLWKQKNKRGRGVPEDRYEARAKLAGEKAVPSILRDWVKGQVLAIECGLMPFESAFMPHMLMRDGSRVIDHATKLLAGPKGN